LRDLIGDASRGISFVTTRLTSERESVRRKAALDAARTALSSGSVSEMRRALSLLPNTGTKAIELRAKLVSKIARSDTLARPIASSAARNVEHASTFALASHLYLIEVRPLGHDAPLLRVQAHGGHVLIDVNQNHLAFHALSNECGQLSKPVRLLLTGLAVLETEAGSARRRERLADSRLDLDRVLARICSQDDQE
jgi:hypothetical protein